MSENKGKTDQNSVSKEEIDDFISDVRMSGISKITDKLKRYQRNIEQHQEIDWGDAEISGGVEVDDWD